MEKEYITDQIIVKPKFVCEIHSEAKQSET